MGEQLCDAVSHEGFDCALPIGHLETRHDKDDVSWSDYGRRVSKHLCLSVADEPGPLPARCSKNRGHDEVAHESAEHGRVIDTWNDTTEGKSA